jgi:hypothetical protein
MHPAVKRLYMRLLGAKVGENVEVSNLARLGEYELVDFGDNCQTDKALVPGYHIRTSYELSS